MFKSTFLHLFDRFRRLDDCLLKRFMFKSPSHHLSDKFRWVANRMSIRQKSFIFFQISTYRKQSFECSESTCWNDPSPSPRPIGKWHSDLSIWSFDAHRKPKIDASKYPSNGHLGKFIFRSFLLRKIEKFFSKGSDSPPSLNPPLPSRILSKIRKENS